MKIALINFSGNVGKSTLANHLFMPRMKGATFIPIESINADESEEAAMRGKEFGLVMEHLLSVDKAIVDIGASNIEEFMRLMHQFRGSHDDFDYFIVPAVKVKKQQKDTIATIEGLNKLGVSPKKIRLVFNMVEVDDRIEDTFSGLFGYQEVEKKFWIHPNAAVEHTEVFEKVRKLGTTIPELVADQTDYRAKIKDEKDLEAKRRYIDMLSAQRLAYAAQENLDAVYKLIFSK